MKPFSVSENLRRARWYARHDQSAVALGILIDCVERLTGGQTEDVRRWVSQASGWLGQAADVLCESEPTLAGRLRACAEAGRELLRESSHGAKAAVELAPAEGNGRGPAAAAGASEPALRGPDGGG